MLQTKSIVVAPTPTEVADDDGASVGLVGQKKSSGAFKEGAAEGCFVLPSTDGLSDGLVEGISVGMDEMVGRGEMVGAPLGAIVGDEDTVGLSLGTDVGLGVT